MELKNNMSNLISEPETRYARAEEKEMMVINFLRDELYSTTQVLADVLDIARTNMHALLNRLVKKGLVVKDSVSFMAGRDLVIWGITNDGLFHGVSPEQISTMSLRYHKTGTVKATTVQHYIDTQVARIFLLRNGGFKRWIPDRLLDGKGLKKNHPKRWAHYPDAVAIRINDEKQTKFAIEIERTRKTPGRYIGILKCHKKNIEAGHYNAVCYICPTDREAKSLQALIVRLHMEKEIKLYLNENIYPPEQSVKVYQFKAIEEFK